MSNYFERTTKFPNARMPEYATMTSAGSDLFAAETVIIPSYNNFINAFNEYAQDAQFLKEHTFTLKEMEYQTKMSHRPTLVSTGLRAHLDDDYYLQIVSRSSLPLKAMLIIANAPGIIDADYYYSDNEGEIKIEFLNFSPFDIVINKGDKIAQAILCQYKNMGNAARHSTIRNGGFGSTAKTT